jgi:hypothetical protein
MRVANVEVMVYRLVSGLLCGLCGCMRSSGDGWQMSGQQDGLCRGVTTKSYTGAKGFLGLKPVQLSEKLITRDESERADGSEEPWKGCAH